MSPYDDDDDNDTDGDNDDDNDNDNDNDKVNGNDNPTFQAILRLGGGGDWWHQLINRGQHYIVVGDERVLTGALSGKQNQWKTASRSDLVKY